MSGRPKIKEEPGQRHGFLIENSAWQKLLEKAAQFDMTPSRYLRFLIRQDLGMDDIEVREE